MGTSLDVEMEAKGFCKICARLLYTLELPHLQMTQSSSRWGNTKGLKYRKVCEFKCTVIVVDDRGETLQREQR